MVPGGFQPVAPRRPKFPGLVEQMADGSGITVSLRQIEVMRPWILEYRDRRNKLRFGFRAYRDENYARDPISPPKDYWIVEFTYMFLISALYAAPERDADRLAEDVQAKITAALLAWPLDAQLNTVQATSVRFEIAKEPTLAEVAWRAADERQNTKQRTRRQFFRSVVVLVVAILLLRWARQNL